MLQGGFENMTVLLAVGETITPNELASVIHGRPVEVRHMSPDEFCKRYDTLGSQALKSIIRLQFHTSHYAL